MVGALARFEDSVSRRYGVSVIIFPLCILYPFALYSLLGFDLAALSTMAMILYLEATHDI